MPKPSPEFHRPVDPKQAAQLLHQAGVVPLMLGPRGPEEPLAGREAVVDLSLLNLNYIRQENDGRIHIGAMTPLQAVAEAALVNSQAGGLLAQAAHLAAASAMRHLATLGGAVVAPKGPPEVRLVLLALEASVVLHHNGKRSQTPLAEYTPGEGLLIEIHFAPSRAQAALQRVARTPKDEAIVAAAALLEIDGGICRKVRLTLGGAGPQPVLVRSVEQVLTGKRLTPALFRQAAQAAAAAVNPSPDFRGSADYRRAMAEVLTRRALEAAAALAHRS